MSADDSFVATALDPRRSVVVEACAGSGKTWLLVSRLIRLLLAGARPGEILAITYTRKAAREIEQRLRLWLRQLAAGDDAFVHDFLQARGLDAAQVDEAAGRARGLYEALLCADPPPTITTFHGWFSRILQGAPLDSGLAGFSVAETSGRMLEEAWAKLARRCAGDASLAETAALTRLLAELGLHNTRALLAAFIDRRAEWLAWCCGSGHGTEVADSLARLRAETGVAETPTVLAGFLARPALGSDIAAYASLLADGTAGEQRQAARLEGWPGSDGADERFERLCAVLLTGKGELRARKVSKASIQRHGQDGAERLASLHASLGAQVLATRAALNEERQYRINRDAQIAGDALRRDFDEIRHARRALDFTDLEWQVDRMLCDAERAPFVQARLDARYRHILLDEFQDTNPLQWRILQSWLAAYGEDAARPGVFVVGDPKQSIYRFRRADFRIFGHVRQWLAEHFAAARLDKDTTYRNAPALVDVVNTLFSAEPEFEGFRPQRAHRQALAGRVELLALIGDDDTGEAAVAAADRNPLLAPRCVAEDLRRRREAVAVVARLSELVGSVEVSDEGGPRPARWGDVMLLSRRRAVLPEFERALREAGVPYLSVSRGGLLETLEARDLLALLRALLSPGDDLSLAHVLRTPLFAVADSELMRLACRDENGWWQRMQAVPYAESPALAEARTKLLRWSALSRSLPVHDLLDKVFDEGQVMARYRAAVPAAMWPAVAANLEAFIGLALAVDSGRYPSLTRFVDELAQRARPKDDQAPDEGVLPGQGGDRLRLLTVHGAKGLEAPLVWLVDAAANREQADSYQPLIAWPPGADRPSHFSLFTTASALGPGRADIIAQEQAAARRERLNLLYVALTRASQYFLASGVVPRGSDEETDYGRLRRAIGDLAGDSALASGAFAWREGVPQAPAVHEPAPVPAPVPAIGERRCPLQGDAQIDFGVQLHAWLERTTEDGAAPAGFDDGVVDMGRRILGAAALQRFFDPSQYLRASNEVPFVRPDGSSGRIDRLVWRDDGLWIVDYKSGSRTSPRVAEYRRQLDEYRDALSLMWPEQGVHCVLVFGDASHLSW